MHPILFTQFRQNGFDHLIHSFHPHMFAEDRKLHTNSHLSA